LRITRRSFVWSPLLCLTLITVLTLSACAGRSNVFTESRDERLNRLDDERARLARSTGPVDRTRAQIRISSLLISLMGDAVGDGDLERMGQRVTEYRESVTDARDTMLESGRDATGDSNGFRDLEIALRQHRGQIEDIRSQLTFQFREPLDTLIDDVAQIRDELLEQLFPTVREGA
jgi:hypothetical protein